MSHHLLSSSQAHDIGIQQVLYLRTFKLQAFRDVSLHGHGQSHQLRMTLQLALRLLLQRILQLYHLPRLLPPPVSHSSCLFTQCQPPYASCSSWTTVLFKELYYQIKNVFVCVCLLVMYYLCEKYIINLLEYSTTQPIVLVGYLD